MNRKEKKLLQQAIKGCETKDEIKDVLSGFLEEETDETETEPNEVTTKTPENHTEEVVVKKEQTQEKPETIEVIPKTIQDNSHLERMKKLEEELEIIKKKNLELALNVPYGMLNSKTRAEIDAYRGLKEPDTSRLNMDAWK
jgi:hypothetical protein